MTIERLSKLFDALVYIKPLGDDQYYIPDDQGDTIRAVADGGAAIIADWNAAIEAMREAISRQFVMLPGGKWSCDECGASSGWKEQLHVPDLCIVAYLQSVKSSMEGKDKAASSPDKSKDSAMVVDPNYSRDDIFKK